jgi:hypothetical protein
LSAINTKVPARRASHGFDNAEATVAQDPKLQNLPYVAVQHPEFISASAATFMNADDRVIGLMSGKSAKAHRSGTLAQHGLVEDDSPSGPIAVTW